MKEPIETIPLFTMKRTPAPRASETAPLLSVAFGRCPRCDGGRKRVGMLRTATHLVWRPHPRILTSGRSTECLASGVAICQVPDPDGQQCDCETGGTAWPRGPR